MRAKERVILSLILLLVLVLVVADLSGDWYTGTSVQHLLAEALIGLLAIAGIAALWAQVFLLRGRVALLQETLQVSQADAERWRSEHSTLLRGLGAAIDEQFSRWKLSPSEREIALLLLKGLSLKEVAEIRNTSERTVRQQSLSIYAKAGLAGRAELAAFFLEDLLLPAAQPGSGPK